MLTPKKKNSCGSKIPHLPRNFSNGPSLTRFNLLGVSDVIQFTISFIVFVFYFYSLL